MDYFRFQDPDDGISHLEWETVRVKFMKAGTLEKLVESLTSDDGELESTYINIFFATYRTFATPEKVLSLILERLVQSFIIHFVRSPAGGPAVRRQTTCRSVGLNQAPIVSDPLPTHTCIL